MKQLESIMKARPILFKPDMVNAILEGRKTQTRRIVKRWADGRLPDFVAGAMEGSCPYGAPGDLLWVRESWGIIDDNTVETGAAAYRATDPMALDKWRPSIHMPRWASRLTLEITDVRVERLQDISEDDAECEGVTPATPPEQTGARHKPAFRHLWEDINGEESWSANPWVWVVEFEPHHMNVDAFLRGREVA